MRTTISVLGLNEMLDPYLTNFEYDDLDEDLFHKKFCSIKKICHGALQESRTLLSTL